MHLHLLLYDGRQPRWKDKKNDKEEQDWRKAYNMKEFSFGVKWFLHNNRNEVLNSLNEVFIL